MDGPGFLESVSFHSGGGSSTAAHDWVTYEIQRRYKEYKALPAGPKKDLLKFRVDLRHWIVEEGKRTKYAVGMSETYIESVWRKVLDDDSLTALRKKFETNLCFQGVTPFVFQSSAAAALLHPVVLPRCLLAAVPDVPVLPPSPASSSASAVAVSLSSLVGASSSFSSSSSSSDSSSSSLTDLLSFPPSSPSAVDVAVSFRPPPPPSPPLPPPPRTPSTSPPPRDLSPDADGAASDSSSSILTDAAASAAAAQQGVKRGSDGGAKGGGGRSRESGKALDSKRVLRSSLFQDVVNRDFLDFARLHLSQKPSTVTVANHLQIDRQYPGIRNLLGVHSTVEKVADEYLCAAIIDAAEKVGFSTSEHKFAKSVSVCVRNSELLMDLTCPLHNIVCGLVSSLYGLTPKQWSLTDVRNKNALKDATNDLFISKYEGSKRSTGLNLHRDGSDISYVVPLNDLSRFVDGGTFFPNHQSKRNGFISRAELGHVSLHFGSVEHARHNITSGTRYILAGFINVENFSENGSSVYPVREMKRSLLNLENQISDSAALDVFYARYFLKGDHGM